MANSIAATASGIEDWLNTAINHEQRGDFRNIQLDTIRDFLKLLPTPPAPCTIAGTKGKGSTTRLIECALNAAHLPTIAFTSPHLTTVLERWRRNGLPAQAEEIAQACTRVAFLEESHHVQLTYFERTFAVACLLASTQPGTFFLCEVGLGGRLDCANALDCAVAVLTHLSHDHRDILGPTLHHLAREKLAIARPGRPLVIAPQSVTAALAIWRSLASRPWGSSHTQEVSTRTTTDPETNWVRQPTCGWQLALPGDHQQDNAATAATALHSLAPGMDDQTMRLGFAQARLAGRCQLIEHDGRRLLVDGAHNGPSMAATMQVARKLLSPGWHMILGVARDKEIDEILQSLAPGVSVARCGYRSTRARQAEHWPETASAWPWFTSISQALEAQPAGIDVCISGSLYLAGEALSHVGMSGVMPG